MIYRFGDRLVPVTIEEWDADRSPAVFVTDSRHADTILAKAGIIYENEIHVSKIGFCRLENQQDCIVGTLCIPKLLDVLGSRYRMYFFVNRSNVVIVDDEDFSERLIRRIQQTLTRCSRNTELFAFNGFSLSDPDKTADPKRYKPVPAGQSQNQDDPVCQRHFHSSMISKKSRHLSRFKSINPKSSITRRS